MKEIQDIFKTELEIRDEVTKLLETQEYVEMRERVRAAAAEEVEGAEAEPEELGTNVEELEVEDE